MTHLPGYTALTPSAEAELSVDWLEQEEQKLVSAAIDILKRQRNLNEDEAHLMLCDMANKRKTSLVDIAQKLMTISRKLTV